jgi:hypothetical protein
LNKLDKLLPDDDAIERMADRVQSIVNARKPVKPVETGLAPANDNTAKPKTMQAPANFLRMIEEKIAPLPVIDPRDWQGKPVPERQWFVEGWIPHRTVTNLSGDGGSGKTEIILQLIAASALRTQWFRHRRTRRHLDQIPPTVRSGGPLRESARTA